MSDSSKWSRLVTEEANVYAEVWSALLGLDPELSGSPSARAIAAGAILIGAEVRVTGARIVNAILGRGEKP